MEFLAEALGFFDFGNNVVTYVDRNEDEGNEVTDNDGINNSKRGERTKPGGDMAEDESDINEERKVSFSPNAASPPPRPQSSESCRTIGAPSIPLSKMIARRVVDYYAREVSSHIADTAKAVSSPPIFRRLLARKVVKQCANGDTFSGFVDAVTGELIHGRRTYLQTGEVYEGPFLHGKRHGNGAESKRLDGSKFLGSYIDDHPHEGTLVTNTFTYQGPLALPTRSSSSVPAPEALFHGTDGTLVQKNGDVYEGDFFEGKYHGYGTEKTASGLTYCGQYEHGKWHGYGDLTVVRRRPLPKETGVGDLTNLKEDVGIPPSFNKDVFRYKYSGDWNHGEREGIGFEKVIFGLARRRCAADDSSSVRSHKDGGRGRTAMYEGEFRKDRRNGRGTLILPDGTEIEGTWKSGLPVTKDERVARSQGDQSDDDETVLCHNLGSSIGSKSKSSVRRKKRKRPQWKITYPNLDMYQGDCADTGFLVENPNDGMRSHLHIDISAHLTLVPSGRGIMIYGETLDVYAGEFYNGKRHGYGRCIYRDSSEEYDGRWEDDVPINIEEKKFRSFQPYFDYHLIREGKASKEVTTYKQRVKNLSLTSKLSLLQNYARISLEEADLSEIASLVPSNVSCPEQKLEATSPNEIIHKPYRIQSSPESLNRPEGFRTPSTTTLSDGDASSLEPHHA